LIYLTLGVAFTALVTTPACFECFFLVPGVNYFATPDAPIPEQYRGTWVNALTGTVTADVIVKSCHDDLGDIVMLCVPAIISLAPIGALMLFHAVLILRGETTLAFLSSKPSSNSTKQIDKLSRRWRWYHFLAPILIEFE
jgi:hypothetical protein